MSSNISHHYSVIARYPSLSSSLDILMEWISVIINRKHVSILSASYEAASGTSAPALGTINF